MVPLVKSNLTEEIKNKECDNDNVEGEIFSMPCTIENGEKPVEKRVTQARAAY